MGNRKISFAEGEFYHVYNRGVDKREIFTDDYDTQRFLQSMKVFNAKDAVGSIYEHEQRHKNLEVEHPNLDKNTDTDTNTDRLVNVIAYCLNPNHFHLLLEQVSENGISQFMQRIGGGYTMYYNEKHERSGALFQGRFKASHVQNNEYLLHLSAYINLNDRVHQLGGGTSRSSWGEYVDGWSGPCKKDVVLSQFKSLRDYATFAEDALGIMQARKKEEKDVSDLVLE